MLIHRYKKAWDSKVERWLVDNIPNLTPYQKECIYDNEIVRFSPFRFYEERKKVKGNLLIRLTIIFIPFVYLAFLAYMPIHFIFTGGWGYKRIEWFLKWLYMVGY